MQITDPIADMLTRIRNAGSAGHETCQVPSSKMKRSIADILLAEGYINGVEYKEDNKQGELTITLKYFEDKPVIGGMKRISKPGLRIYAKAEEVPTVLDGLGVALISTSQGIMTDKNARNAGIGGEVLAFIW
ncbi:MAG: 30S ribosomal protein S8 [Clostridiaceae bacterium]|nr:30S ribosomal protein S8 [Clostridiaceae bacterium]